MGNTYRSKQFKKKKDKETSLLKLFNAYKKRASNLKLPFTITQEQFMDIIINQCASCGAMPRLRLFKIIYNNIGLNESSEGYTLKNCYSCCAKCLKNIESSQKL